MIFLRELLDIKDRSKDVGVMTDCVQKRYNYSISVFVSFSM